jgi:hypothetical protein
MSVNATVNTPRTTTAKLSQANTSQVVRVTVPGPRGDAAASVVTLGEIPNVDTSSVQDGAILQYRTDTSKWEATNDPSTVAGILYINGGNF